VLRDSAELDQEATAHGTLDPQASLVAGGAVVDVSWQVNCRNGMPVADAALRCSPRRSNGAATTGTPLTRSWRNLAVRGVQQAVHR